MNKSILQISNNHARAVFWSLGIVIAVLCLYANAKRNQDATTRQNIIDHFKVATPNAQVKSDAEVWAGDYFDMFSGSYIILFRSDKPTINAFIKKYQMQEQGKETIDYHFQKEFQARDLSDPAGGHYRAMLHKKVPIYTCPTDIFYGNSFAQTQLYWDTQTGTGCFYVHWAD